MHLGMAISVNYHGFHCPAVDSVDSDVQYYTTFDAFISMPEDDTDPEPEALLSNTTETENAPKSKGTSFRSNAMSLAFILSPFSDDLAAIPSSTAARPRFVDRRIESENGLKQSRLSSLKLPADETNTEPAKSAAVLPVSGWAPADGSSFLVIQEPQSDAAKHLVVHTSPSPRSSAISAHSAGHTTAGSPGLHQSSRSTYDVPGSSTRPRAQGNVTTPAAVPRAANPLATRGIPQAPAPSLALPHFYALGLPASGFPAQASMHSFPAGPVATTAPSRPPPPPKGGVSPALARSITHIRLARERAQHLASQAVRPNTRTPSVMAKKRIGGIVPARADAAQIDRQIDGY